MAQVEAVFGEVELITGVADNECGFVTAEMTEAEYREKAAKMGNIIGMIRVD